MKINKQIIISTLAILALLTSGCSKDESSDSSAETPTNPIEPPAVVDPYKTAGWYGKTEVTATAPDGTIYSHTTAGVFGELVQSSDDQDQHDIPGYGPSLLQVIFVPDFSTDTETGYFSDYRKYDESNTKQSWTFLVKNQNTIDLSTAPITISLPAIHDVRYKDDNGSITYKESSESNVTLLNQLTLVDVDNTTTYTVAELETATLNMDGKHIRTFRWVLGAVDQDDYNPLPAPQRAAARNAAPTFQAAPAKSGGKFGLPPQ